MGASRKFLKLAFPKIFEQAVLQLVIVLENNSVFPKVYLKQAL